MGEAARMKGQAMPATGRALDALTFQATVHCLTGCSIGEVLGMVLGSWLDWPAGRTIVVSVVLAFLFGYALTMRPLLGSGMAPAAAARLALAADTLSITVMEIVDNAVMVIVPGAMEAPLTSVHFWATLLFALILAGAAAFPVNRWLIARGGGHAVVHSHHGPATGAPPPAHLGHGGHSGHGTHGEHGRHGDHSH